MTELTLGLVVVGVAAIAGVLIFNRRQERAVRKDAERAFGSSHRDVLVADPQARREPTLKAAASPDPRVDYVLELTLSAQAAIALAREWPVIEQRFAGRALLAPGEDGKWRGGLQLVSRAGAVKEAELLEFRSAVETLAARVRAKVSAPGMREALEAARELDSACAEADIQVALHVLGVPPGHSFPDQPFHAAPREDGVTLTLDVARTADPAASYEAMARAARELAQSRGGRLVDDRGRELDDRALAAIGAQLETVCRLLIGRGIEPGSPLALRLFS
jgi:hypothetical protein